MSKKYFECRSEHAIYPARATRYSAGYDLVATGLKYNREANVVIYDTGVGLTSSFPHNVFGDLRARSSIYKKDGWFLINGAGVIDADYDGTIKLCFRNVDPDMLLEEHPYEIGDRVGQLVLCPYLTEEDRPTTKRKGGYGSTGK